MRYLAARLATDENRRWVPIFQSLPVLVRSKRNLLDHLAEVFEQSTELPGLGPVLEEPALAEIGIGAWQGHRAADIHAANPGLPHASDPHLWKFHAPGGERMHEMVDRLSGFLSRLDGPSVVVTHGVTSRMLVPLRSAPMEAACSAPINR